MLGSFIRSDVIHSDVIRSVFIRSDVIHSDVICSVIIRSVGESTAESLTVAKIRMQRAITVAKIRIQ